MYQIVWQRCLFTIYGVNIQSVTVIVTVFMLGLGLGSLAGGRLSTAMGGRALRYFGAIELSIGVFGLASLHLFRFASSFTAGFSTTITGLATFALLLVPTLLMGSTLPLLVAHLVQRSANVGDSVGSLYSVNTLGSGVACLLASLFYMQWLGESGSVRMAASMNLLVGTAALFLSARRDETGTAAQPAAQESQSPHRTIPIQLGMLLAGLTGFIALAYEILWYRVYSFTSGGRATCFATLLAFYLFGIAYGAFAIHDLCKGKLKNDLRATINACSTVVILATIAAFSVGPAVAFAESSSHYVPYEITFVFVAIAAALLGAAFPLLCHASIDPVEKAGRKTSYLYLSNILGSALGSFLIGFVVLDHWSTAETSLALLGLGGVLAIALAGIARPFKLNAFLLAGFVVCLLLAAFHNALFPRLYERLLYKWLYRENTKFVELVENRSGEIAVDDKETVYGSGAYDGHFNIDPVTDTNAIIRAYAIAGLHANPRHVLIIGLSSGSWAQILTNHPSVEDVTIVEINPGYLQLIRERAQVASLLQNPKVHIVIDDGRRWLVGHPNQRFDFILMNTTFNWRANISNLLSVEFLQILRNHLRPAGVAYYNTTDSGEVQRTGATVFPYALRVLNFLAVSDSPIPFDRARLKTVLQEYRIDGRRIFDPNSPRSIASLERIVLLPQSNGWQSGHGLDFSIEDGQSILKRTSGLRIITDDNMGTEWK
ncbi:MAG TPA: fused MFS/spermidine synthase [Terracidiphilus sp.]